MGKENVKTRNRSRTSFKTALCNIVNSGLPFDSVTVKQICEEAGYSSMAFYGNFENKYDLAQSIVDDEVELYLDILKKYSHPQYASFSIRQRHLKCAEEYFQHIFNNKSMYTAILNSDMYPGALEYLCTVLAKKVVFLKLNYDEDKEPAYQEYVWSITFSILYYTVKYWIRSNWEFSPQKMAKFCNDSLYDKVTKTTYKTEMQN